MSYLLLIEEKGGLGLLINKIMSIYYSETTICNLYERLLKLKSNEELEQSVERYIQKETIIGPIRYITLALIRERQSRITYDE